MTATAARYAGFAVEARGCPAYRLVAETIAQDAALIAWIDTLPPAKRQPNLLFACLRLLTGTVPSIEALRDMLSSDADRLRTEMMRRSTQTNEAARCGVLLPWLSRLPQPIALLEVGASAVMFLFADQYGYDYGTHRLEAPGDGPVFPCHVGAGIAGPAQLPQVAWRAGIDLNPLNPGDADDLAWLDALVWPGQDARRARLHQAARVAAHHGQTVRRGDLGGDDVARLAATAPGDATLVIFHTAVLAYLPDVAARRDFAQRAQRLAPVWLAVEAPHVMPWISAPKPPDLPANSFCITLNGSAVGWADPHGAWVRGMA